jgi:S-DNA-T family DNA segregation ATPase FtsK/SpoIIIE
MADSTTTVEEEAVKAGLLAAGAVVAGLVFGVWFALRHPRSTALVVVGVAAYVYLGPTGLTVAAVALAALLVVWRWRHRASFDWCLLGPWRRATRYSWRWAKAIPMCGLDQPFRPTHTALDELVDDRRTPTRRYLPKLGRVLSDQWCDRVSVRLLNGQHPGMWEDCTDQLAHTFGAMACRVECPQPGRVVLVFQHRDRLAGIVPALPVPDAPDLSDLPIGVLDRRASAPGSGGGRHTRCGTRPRRSCRPRGCRSNTWPTCSGTTAHAWRRSSTATCSRPRSRPAPLRCRPS